MVQDLASTRLDNALRLFEEFVQATVKHPDAATLRGLEGRFAERLGIQPSYWSQIKSRARQIGERLARQFEQACHKPHGWMDQPHAASAPAAPRRGAVRRVRAGRRPGPAAGRRRALHRRAGPHLLPAPSAARPRPPARPARRGAERPRAAGLEGPVRGRRRPARSAARRRPRPVGTHPRRRGAAQTQALNPGRSLEQWTCAR